MFKLYYQIKKKGIFDLFLVYVTFLKIDFLFRQISNRFSAINYTKFSTAIIDIYY